MPRPEKVQAVAEIKERIQNARAVFLAEYAGLSVKQQQVLRRELRANGAEFKVMKMTLARIAAAELNIDSLDEHLLGPTGITIADTDAVAAAKVLKDFAKANEVFRVKGGLLGLEYLSPERVSELAEIEPRDVLLAKVAGLLAAPMSNVLGLFEAVQRDVVGLTQALVDKRLAAGEVAEPAADSEHETAPSSTPEGASEAAAPEAEVSAAVDEAAEAVVDAEVLTEGSEDPEVADNAQEAPAESEPEAAADVAPEAALDEEVADGPAPEEAAADEAPSDDAGDDENTEPSNEGNDEKAEEE